MDAIADVPVDSIADDRTRTLDPRQMVVSRLVGAIVTTVISLSSLIAVAIVAVAAPLSWTMVGLLVVGWLVLTGLLVWLTLAWPGLEFRHTTFRVNPRGIEIRRGVVWREVVTVPRSRVQHTDVSQGPLQRNYGVATLIMHTAGHENASVALAGVEAETAARIRDFLISGTGQDAV